MSTIETNDMPTPQAADQEAMQKLTAQRIRQGCDIRYLSSIMQTWDAFLQSGCPEAMYATYLMELDISIAHLISTTKDPVALGGMRDQLQVDPVRYGKYIQRITDKLTAQENELRTFRGILYDTTQEAEQVKEEAKQLDIIMCTVSRDDMESIEKAEMQIRESTARIKDSYLTTLQGYKDALLLQKRTFRGVEYESPERAAYAQHVFTWARDIVNNLNRSDEAAVQAAYDRFVAAEHPAVEEFTQQMQSLLKDFDIQKRTVDGVLFETEEEAQEAHKELYTIAQIMSTLKPDNEASLLEAKEKLSACNTAVKEKYLAYVEKQLQAYDIAMRTFRDKVCETRAEAAILRNEEAAIRDAMAAVQPNHEPSLLHAKLVLSSMTTYLKDEPAASVDRMLQEYDQRVRTVDGVLYETREQAALVIQEKQTAGLILQKVTPENEQSILDAQQEILTLTTPIRDASLDYLKKLWEALDLKLRTFGSFVFETRNQAQIAQSTYSAFMQMFNTMDLEQPQNLVILDNYIEDTLQEMLRPHAKQMVESVRSVLRGIAYIHQTDAIINLTTQKKESADLYQYIEQLLPHMTQYRMRTESVKAIQQKHFASLNMAKKVMSLFKKH